MRIILIHGEIVPEYLSAIQQRPFMFDERNSSALGQNHICMIRRKRDWLIPHVSVPENDKGPFPKEVVKMKSTAAGSMRLIYNITGAGADQPPEGLFTVDKYTGMLKVTKSLDREETEEYILTIYASGIGLNDSFKENPVKLTIKVIDQNDNKPLCTQDPFMGEIPERAKENEPIIQVTAKDIDDPETANGIVHYKLVRPNGGLFHIDPVSGVISLATVGILDRENQTVYELAVEAADMYGHGLSSTCMVIVKITDSNDHAPRFSQRKYAGTVQENKAGAIVARLDVTDRDEPFTANSVAKFIIIQGNEKGLFNISTAPSGMEGIIMTSKGLDFEQTNSFVLLVVVKNEVPFAIPLVTSTATVSITVQDVNEPPVFETADKQIVIPEDQKVGSTISKYTANDPDTAREQKIRYKLQQSANWLEITEDTGIIKVRSSLDREASFIRNEQYTVLVLAYDNDDDPATGTGTLVIKLQDVNDNAPVLEERSVLMCLTEPKPVRLTITDADGPGNGPPFIIELNTEYQRNWTIISNSSSGVVLLKTLRPLALGEYSLVLRMYDSKSLFQDSSIIVEVCNCKGDDVTCSSGIAGSPPNVTFFIYVLAAILCSLVLFLLLILLKRRCGRKVQWGQFKHKEEDRDNIICYNEEGGGEQDQDFDMVLLCSGLDVFSTDIAPMDSPTFFYRQHPDENEDIMSVLYENLCTADDDHFVAPYDSMLVFTHEGEGSLSGSLSSLQSSIGDGDQDFQHLQNWGPQFRTLADMFAGEGE
ncbi:B-cadherin-like [Carassius gibelio]|uniref:B-cadherin-like n=1 Tax=Carassius gibelio TaxID=101364 RepID=UPI0022790FD8|nr:B-cadherin-like [Carassius gibelio]